MYLTCGTLASYLIARETLEPQSIVRGDFVIVEAGRRNRNFKVFQTGAPGLFVKQAPMPVAEVHETLRREAIVHEMISTRPSFAVLSDMILQMRDYDPRRSTITFELAAQGRNLHEVFQADGSDQPGVARQIGRRLARLHAAGSAIMADAEALHTFPRRQPWILHMARNAESIMPGMSEGQRQVVAALRGDPALLALFDALVAEWRENAFCHGDVKWDNMLLIGPAGEEADIRLIDWELADIADAAWDVGCAVASFLQRAAMFGGATPHVAGPAAAPGYDLSQRAAARESANALVSIQLLLQSYLEAFRVGGGPVEAEVRHRVTRFTVGRLVLAAFEMVAGAPRITPQVEAMMRLASHMAANPAQAAARLFTPSGTR